MGGMLDLVRDNSSIEKTGGLAGGGRAAATCPHQPEAQEVSMARRKGTAVGKSGGTPL